MPEHFSNYVTVEDKGQYSTGDAPATSGGGVDPDLIAQGIISAVEIAKYFKRDEDKVALKRKLRQLCGRKPLFGRERKERYEKCRTSFLEAIKKQMLANQPPKQITKPTSGKKGIPTGVWIVGGLVVIGIIGAVVYKMAKK